jgi:hypothetical protein
LRAQLDLNVSAMIKVSLDNSFVINKAARRSHDDEAGIEREKIMKIDAFFRSLNPLLWPRKFLKQNWNIN